MFELFQGIDRGSVLLWAGRFSLVTFIVALAFSATPAHAQTVDPTTIWTAILTFITGPAGKILAALAVVTVGIACIAGHHPLAGIALLIGGITLIFSSQFFIQQFIGG